MDQYEYSFTDRKAKEEEFRLQKLELEKKEKELAAQLAAQRAREDTRRAKEEAERIAKEKAAREEAERVAREQEAARQQEQQAAADAATKRAKEDDAQRTKEEKARLARTEAEPVEQEETPIDRMHARKPRRNMGCNIPFAYLVPHCWRLAKTNPIFGLKNENDLVFLQ
eukprot:jgi/Psemu1/300630/fgenesh1_kg.15_\